MKAPFPISLFAAGLLCLSVRPSLMASEHLGGVEHHADTATSVALPLPGVLDVSDPNDLLIRQPRAATLRIPYASIRFYHLSPFSKPSKRNLQDLLTLGYQERDGSAHSLVLQIPATRAQGAVKDLEEQTGFKAGSEPMPYSPLPVGTRVSCRLERSLSSARDDAGKPVELSVIEDVRVNGRVVIPQGSPVTGTIVQSEGTWRTGKTGKLDFSIDKVEAIDGQYLPLRYNANEDKTTQESGKPGVPTGVLTAGAGVLFWPEAPFFLLPEGKDVAIQKGVVIAAFLATGIGDEVAIGAPSPGRIFSERRPR